MLALVNRTPYAAERAFVRDGDGVDHWVVAVRATFDLAAHRAVSLADEQPAPLLTPEYWGGPGVSSLRYESDVTLQKPSTDVLVNGAAHAPAGRPAKEVAARLRVGKVDKTIVARGRSFFFKSFVGVAETEPEPFEKMPLRYESAYGGTDTLAEDPREHRMDARNPVGVGFAARAEHLENRPAPTVVYAGVDPAKAGPAGFGALASYWSPRRELGGTYDQRWHDEQAPLLPKDWQPASLQCAPLDQRLDGHLRGGELVELTHLTPEGTLRFALPRIYLAFATHFGSRVEEHRSRLVTVVVEPDEARLVLVWQTSLRVPLRQIDHLDKTVITEKAYVR
jgi:hypothetical protein